MAKQAEIRKRRMADATERASMSGGSSIARPEHLALWSYEHNKDGKPYTVDFFPYVVTKEQSRFAPATNVGKLDQWYFERTYYTHRQIGPNQETVVCLARTFDKPCPVCDERRALEQDPKFGRKSKEVEALHWSQRMCMIVFVHEEKDKGLQLFDVSNHAFGKALNIKINGSRPEMIPAYKQFYDPTKDGFGLRLVSITTASGSGSYGSFSVNEFIPRKRDLDPELVQLAEGTDLALVPVELTYKDLEKKLHGEESSPPPDRNGDTEPEEESRTRRAEIDDEPPPRRGRRDDPEEQPRGRRGRDEEPELDEAAGVQVGDEVQFMYRGEKHVGIVKSMRGTLCRIEEEGRDDLRNVEADELEPATRDEKPRGGRGREEEEPTPRKRREPEPEDEPTPRRGRREEEPEPEEAPRGRRSARTEEDDPPPRRRATRDEDEPFRDEPEEKPRKRREPEPEDEPAPRRGRR